MRSRTFGLFSALLGASFLMTSCGGSSSSSGSSRSATGATPAASSTSAPTTGAAAGAIPAVDHAGDLETEPVIHPGGGTPPTALAIHDLVVGSGPVATATGTVTIRYTGALYSTGEVFDDSPWSKNRPAVFPLNQVVPGFAQGIAGMKVGGRREIVIPPSLGYGSNTNGPIPGNSTLVFVVDLLAVS